jgi:anti-sigma B factor antagonist
MTAPPFELRSSPSDDTLIVEVVGEIDMATAPELAAAIASAEDGVQRVVVDLTEVTFLDSSALNTLVHCQRKLAEREIGLRVVSPADRVVRRVFEITRLIGPLNVVESLDDARA